MDPEEEAAARLAKRRAKERKLQLAEETFGRVGAMQLASEDDDKSESNDSQSVTSVERDRIYGTGHIDHNSMSGVITQSIRTEILPLESTHPLVLRRDNDKTYNTYLQQSHYQRNKIKQLKVQRKIIARGGVDPNDPFSTNMGLERGLDEPVLRMPKAGEPLYVANGTSGERGGASRLPVDENRLINKKYSATPSTQAEMKDCSAELNLEQLKSVVASHKV